MIESRKMLGLPVPTDMVGAAMAASATLDATKKTTVVIEIKGGEVHAAYSDNPNVSVQIFDWDRVLPKERMTMKERQFLLTHATKHTPHKVHENNGV